MASNVPVAASGAVAQAAVPAVTPPMTAQWVATEFVKRYYDVLANHPRYLPKFYKEESTFTLNGETVKTQTQIQEKVLSTIQGATVHATHVDAQLSSGQGVLLQVLGTIKYRDGKEEMFSQSFFLAPQAPRGYFVLNDVIRTSSTAASASVAAPIAQANGHVVPVPVQQPVRAAPVPAAAPAAQAPVVQQPIAAEPEPAVEAAAARPRTPEASGTSHREAAAAAAAASSSPAAMSYAARLKANIANGSAAAPAAAPAAMAPISPARPPAPAAAAPAQQQPLDVPQEVQPAAAAAPASAGAEAADEVELRGVYLSNLSYNTNEAEINEVFSRFGTITRINHNIKFRHAYVDFDTLEAAQAAVRAGKVVLAEQEVEVKKKLPRMARAPGSGGRGYRNGMGGGEMGRGYGGRGRGEGGRMPGRGRGREGGERGRGRGMGYMGRGDRDMERASRPE